MDSANTESRTFLCPFQVPEIVGRHFLAERIEHGTQCKKANLHKADWPLRARYTCLAPSNRNVILYKFCFFSNSEFHAVSACILSDDLSHLQSEPASRETLEISLTHVSFCISFFIMRSTTNSKNSPKPYALANKNLVRHVIKGIDDYYGTLLGIIIVTDWQVFKMDAQNRIKK